MKRFIIILLVLLNCCIFGVSVSAEEITYQNVITDDTEITDDLDILGLTYEDYIIDVESKSKLEKFFDEQGYSEQFVIAVGENYSLDDIHIISYIYCYNPLFWYSDINVGLSITLNGTYYDTLDYDNVVKELEIIKEDRIAGIICFKITNLFKKTDFVRKYKIDINNSGMDPFECNYKTEITGATRLDYVNYDSIIYIQKDEVVPVVFRNYTSLSNLLQQDSNGALNEFFASLGLTSSKYKPQVLYFYNFSSSKKIDQIHTANMKWIYTYATTGPTTKYENCSYQELIDYCNDGTLTHSNGKNGYDFVSGWFDNAAIIYKDNNSDVNFQGQILNIQAFKTPAADRLKEFGTNYTNEMSASEKKKFTEYEHSILFALGNWEVDIGGSISNFQYYLVDNVRLTKLVYETDGVIYSSVVGDLDGPDTPTNPIDPFKPKENFWYKLYQFFVKIGGWIVKNIFRMKWAPNLFKAVLGGITSVLIIILVILVLLIWIPKLIAKILIGIFGRK